MAGLFAGAVAVAGVGLLTAACSHSGSSNAEHTSSGPPPATSSSIISTSQQPSGHQSTQHSQPPPVGELKLIAPLSGGGPGGGVAEYDVEHGHRDLEVKLHGFTGLADKTVTVYSGGTRVGTVQIAANGTAERDWQTDHGQKVPTAAAGSTIKVKAASGRVVVSGTYRVQH